MNRLVRAYEEKNKLVQQIQRNLHKPYLQTIRYQHQTINFDLPNITNRKSPRNQSSLEQKLSKKKLEFPRKQSAFSSPKNLQKPWIQTITFKSEELRPRQQKFLIKNPSTSNNFMKTGTRLFRSDSKKSKEGFDDQIFLAPRRAHSFNKSKGSLKYKKPLNNPIQDDLADDFFQLQSMKKSKNKIYSIEHTSIGKLQEKRGFMNHQISTLYSPEADKKGKKVQNMPVSFSPWTSDNSQEISEIWNRQKWQSHINTSFQQ